MNFYDVYTTLSLNPEAEKAMTSICEYCGCMNQMETLKKALWKKPSRAQAPGAFPFDEETGKIYDVLWKAAQTENYGTFERIARGIMKVICPPAEDEGMGKFHAKYHEAPIDEYDQPRPAAPANSYSASSAAQPQNQQFSDVQQNTTPVQEDADNNWEIDEKDVVVSRPKEEAGITKRGNSKKND